MTTERRNHMANTYGYIRVSTRRQNADRQERNILREYPKAILINEVYTRTTFYGRKEWNKLIKNVKEGDTIVFDSVSRMSGNTEEGCKIYEELFNKGVELVFIKEPHINTEVYRKTMENQIQIYISTGNAATDNLINSIIEALNKYTMELAFEQIKLAFSQAEKEVSDLHQRTKEGMETARLNGKQIGTPKGAKLTTKKSVAAKEIIKKHSIDFNGTLKDDDVIKLAGISRKTYYKYKKELREEQ